MTNREINQRVSSAIEKTKKDKGKFRCIINNVLYTLKRNPKNFKECKDCPFHSTQYSIIDYCINSDKKLKYLVKRFPSVILEEEDK